MKNHQLDRKKKMFCFVLFLNILSVQGIGRQKLEGNLKSRQISLIYFSHHWQEEISRSLWKMLSWVLVPQEVSLVCVSYRPSFLCFYITRSSSFPSGILDMMKPHIRAFSLCLLVFQFLLA